MPRPKRSSLWQEFSSRGRMYLVLSVCCLAVALSSLGGLLLLGHPQAEEEAPPQEDLVTENGYDQNAHTIDDTQYDGTILPAGEDAGDAYLQETLFLGDSNTARMYRLFDYCTYDNAIGSVGMAARSLANYACVGFAGYSNYVTMPQAVALMQPRRVIISFGTNDLNPNSATDTFITNYETGIKAVQQAYPSVDVIVNAIPPIGSRHTGQQLTQSQVDEWNKAIVDLCERNGWKFLNSAEALKDAASGYARSDYVESDGIHLTRAAFDAFFRYVRTHSYVTEDDRPALQPVPRHNDDRDVLDTNALATPEPSSEPTEEPTPTPTETPTQTPTETPFIEDPVTDMPSPTPEAPQEPTPTPTETPTEAPTEAPVETPTPTPETPAEPTPEPPAEPAQDAAAQAQQATDTPPAAG